MDQTDILFDFYFQLLFQQEKINFSELSGISNEVPGCLNELEEGGIAFENTRLLGSRTGQTFRIKRFAVPLNSTFLDWCDGILRADFSNGIVPKDLSVCLLNEKEDVLKKWLFREAYPVEWRLSELKSEENIVFIEYIEFAYHSLEIATVDAI